MTELENELAARVEQLERKIEQLTRPKAPPKFEAGQSGPTTTQLAISRVGMSAEVVREMAKATPDGLMREIVGGSAPAQLTPLSEGNARPRVAQEDRSGWRNATPLSSPPGVAIADRLMDAADAVDRVELAQRLARQKVAEGKG
jgi:hypothetical protein